VNPRRDVACAVHGLVACVACAHLVVLGTIEAVHPRVTRLDPAIQTPGLPPEPDHTHRDYDRSARIQGGEMTVSGTSSEARPPGRSVGMDVVPWARYYRYPDASSYFGMPVTLRSTST